MNKANDTKKNDARQNDIAEWHYRMTLQNDIAKFHSVEWHIEGYTECNANYQNDSQQNDNKKKNDSQENDNKQMPLLTISRITQIRIDSSE